MQVGALRGSHDLCPVRKRSQLPISEVQINAWGVTAARRAADPRAEVHPWSLSRKLGGPSSSVILGLKWASPGAQSHFRELVWQAAARWGSGERENRRKASLERVRRPRPADHLFLLGVGRALIGWSAARVPEVADARSQ